MENGFLNTQFVSLLVITKRRLSEEEKENALSVFGVDPFTLNIE